MARGVVAMVVAVVLLSGCELVADFDRSKIPGDAGMGQGGMGGGTAGTGGAPDASLDTDAAVDEDAGSDEDAGL